jgi:hypothetical protein
LNIATTFISINNNCFSSSLGPILPHLFSRIIELSPPPLEHKYLLENESEIGKTNVNKEKSLENEQKSCLEKRPFVESLSMEFNMNKNDCENIYDYFMMDENKTKNFLKTYSTEIADSTSLPEEEESSSTSAQHLLPHLHLKTCDFKPPSYLSSNQVYQDCELISISHTPNDIDDKNASLSENNLSTLKKGSLVAISQDEGPSKSSLLKIGICTEVSSNSKKCVVSFFDKLYGLNTFETCISDDLKIVKYYNTENSLLLGVLHRLERLLYFSNIREIVLKLVNTGYISSVDNPTQLM